MSQTEISSSMKLFLLSLEYRGNILRIPIQVVIKVIKPPPHLTHFFQLKSLSVMPDFKQKWVKHSVSIIISNNQSN